MIFGETSKRIDAAQAYRENAAAEHLCTLLIPLVQQALLCGVGLTLRRGSLAFRDSATPKGKQYGNDAANHETEIANRGSQGFLFSV